MKTAVAAAPGFLQAADTGRAIKVGLVGCGGRGTGAAAQALQADDYAVLTAVADIDQAQIDRSLALIGYTVCFGAESLKSFRRGQLDRQLAAFEGCQESNGKVRVDKDHQFLGLDAFQKVIDSDVDVVILATPPGFRPMHLKAAVEAGKHIFCEKPVAVDAPGIRSVLETVRLSREKNLSLVSGLCWRYNKAVNATMERVHKGAIGDLIAHYANYYTNPVQPMRPAYERPIGMSDVEWQIRNWYNFVWLGGDGLVEQAIHAADWIAWSLRDEPPESCVAVGGRQIPAHGGNIFDHFEVNYSYPNGVRAFLGCRQIPGCHNENTGYMLGSKGRATIGLGASPRIQGKTNWMYRGPKHDMFQEEHDVLFRSIRRGEPVNDGERMTTSTMLAIMGRMAAYTGRQITWKQAMQSEESLFLENLRWDMAYEPPPMAQPGRTKFV